MTVVSNRKSLAIIGAGASGIISSYKASLESEIDFTVYEASDCVGGAWNYKAETSSTSCTNYRRNTNYTQTRNTACHWLMDGKLQPKAIYQNLKTNLPRVLMQFRDTPFVMEDSNIQDENSVEMNREMFPPHLKVKEYLVACAEKWNLLPLIKFNHSVLNVKKNSSKWTLKVLDQISKKTSEIDYDFVFVCNGHFTVPKLPNHLNYRDFPFPILHSQDYRYPDIATGKRILVVGTSWSGQDLVREMSHYASFIYWSSQQTPSDVAIPQTANQERIQVVPSIEKFNKDGSVLLKDGSTIQVATVYMATGYLYSFNFLDSLKDDTSVSGLHLELFQASDPTLCFIGLPRNVLPFPLFEYQAEAAIAFVLGKVSRKDIEKFQSVYSREILGFLDEKESNDIAGLAHDLGSGREFLYCDLLADLYNGPKVPDWKRKLRCNLRQHRIKALGY